MGGTRCYITLFEAPFQASVLTDSENNALRASSLMAIPPPPPGSQPLAGSTAVDLMGNNLTQWALDVQEVASYMWWPPEAAVRCPLMDIIGVLNRLEGLARVRYCRSCFGISPGCQCSTVLFRDASRCSLMTDGGGYMYFSCCYRFYSSLCMYGAILSKKTNVIFLFYINLFCCK